MRRGVLVLAIAIGLAIGSAIPTAAIGLTQVNLSCDDGTSTTLVVDTDTLTGLTAAVQAMIDYPAGLTCTLVQVPLPLLSFGSIALAASPGHNPFIVAPTAFVTSQVTQTSGQQPFPADQSGSVNFPGWVHFGFQDNGSPSTTTDMLNGPPATGTGAQAPDCTAGDPLPIFPLVNGNI